MTTPGDTYNYDTFRPAPYVEGGCDGPEPGEHLGDVAVWQVDGTPTSLSEAVDGVTVLEAGSTTCPLYRGNVRRMHAVSRRHPEVTFVVLYTREAHPGGRRGPHRDLEDKRATAAALPEEAGEWRHVLVDDLEGPLHQRLAGAPNSVLVLDGRARVIRWMHDADPTALDATLAALRDGRPPGDVRASFRPPPPHIAVRALLRGGPRAVWDFALGLPTLMRYRLSGGADC
jgi:hypothetical protein